MNFGKYIAHRGLHNIDKGIPENSLSAFKNACKKGLAIELDVRLTKDGRVVVFHDKSLKRMCGVDSEISEFTYEQLLAFKLKDTDEKIPLLSQVLKLVKGRVPLLIEIKGGQGLFDLEKRTYHLLKKYDGDYAVQSFSFLSMLWFRIFASNIARGQLISTYRGKLKGKDWIKYAGRLIGASPVVWRLVSKPEFIACDLKSVSLEKAFQALDCNADFITWTANSDELMNTAKQFSKSVIFEELSDDFDFSDNWSEN